MIHGVFCLANFQNTFAAEFIVMVCIDFGVEESRSFVF